MYPKLEITAEAFNSPEGPRLSLSTLQKGAAHADPHIARLAPGTDWAPTLRASYAVVEDTPEMRAEIARVYKVLALRD